MSLAVRPIESREEWEGFVLSQKPHTFLHSWNWGEFHKRTGETIFRLGVYRGDALVGAALFVKVEARRGTFLLSPHGPILCHSEGEARRISQKREDAMRSFASAESDSASFRMTNESELLETLVSHTKKIAKEERCHFIRIASLFSDRREYKELFQRLGARDAPVHMVHPERAWILNITPSEEQLVDGMKKSARYSVRKAARDGVKVARSEDPEDVKKFLELYKKTAGRQEFTPFSEKYLQTEAEVFCPDSQGAFFFAEHKGKLVSAAFVVFYGDSGFYHHGASIPQSGVPAPHLVQWEAIREAKRRGCTLYNFWGIAPEGKPAHPWAGLSFFKRSFGGFDENYLHVQDFVLSPRYWLTWAVETARRIKRGL